jgi:hypothetical protein
MSLPVEQLVRALLMRSRIEQRLPLLPHMIEPMALANLIMQERMYASQIRRPPRAQRRAAAHAQGKAAA